MVKDTTHAKWEISQKVSRQAQDVSSYNSAMNIGMYSLLPQEYVAKKNHLNVLQSQLNHFQNQLNSEACMTCPFNVKCLSPCPQD